MREIPAPATAANRIRGSRMSHRMVSLMSKSPSGCTRWRLCSSTTPRGMNVEPNCSASTPLARRARMNSMSFSRVEMVIRMGTLPFQMMAGYMHAGGIPPASCQRTSPHITRGRAPDYPSAGIVRILSVCYPYINRTLY